MSINRYKIINYVSSLIIARISVRIEIGLNLL